MCLGLVVFGLLEKACCTLDLSDLWGLYKNAFPLKTFMILHWDGSMKITRKRVIVHAFDISNS